MYTIYHYPQCRKSRAGLQFLKEKGVQFDVVDYMNIPLTAKVMEMLLVKLNCKPIDLVRKQEEYFQRSLKGKNFEDHEWIKIILNHPKLLQRPIVEARYKAVIGNPVENIETLLK